MKNNVVAIVDAYGTGSQYSEHFQKQGYQCIHVQSRKEISDAQKSTFRAEDFDRNIIHSGNVEETAIKLRLSVPVEVVAANESGAELALELRKALGTHRDYTFLH